MMSLSVLKSKLHSFAQIMLRIVEFFTFHFLDLFRPVLKNIVEFSASVIGLELHGPHPDIKVFDERLYAKVLSSGLVGIYEGYISKWFDAEDIDACYEKLVQHNFLIYLATHHPYNICMSLINTLFDIQTAEHAWKDGGENYDYGIELHKATIGPTMLYSCLRFEGNCTLAEAEQNKYKHLVKLLKLKPGMTVLDVGCGFGSVAEYLARHCDVTVTGLSPSKDMIKIARERCEGLNATFLLSDYREINGKFDRVICIEMSEHVGAHKYKGFLTKCHSLLKDDGLFYLQVVSCNQWYLHEYCGVFEIFLGLRVTFPQLKRVINDSFGLFVVEYIENIGYEYGLTWQAWYEKFMKNWPTISHRFDERFFRTWRLYLLSGSVGFRNRKLQDNAIVFSKDGVAGGYRVNRD